jgi:NDP-sugar pyrophosphorylase family protein
MNDDFLSLAAFLQNFSRFFPELANDLLWHIPGKLEQVLRRRIGTLSSDFVIQGDVAIHKTAQVEAHAVLKGPIIISAHCFVGSHAYFRGGVFVGEHSVVGPGCEIKSTLMLDLSAMAHFNFAGDSLIGSRVNLEAGSVIANHFNEREDKTIRVIAGGKRIALDVTKFGALVGDGTKIGANAVLSPGTILPPNSIVPRLGLVEQ